MKRDYILELNMGPLATDFSINGVPLLRHRVPRDSNYSELLNPWLVRGTNQVELTVDILAINPDWPPQHAAYAQDATRHKVSATITAAGVTPLWEGRFPADQVQGNILPLTVASRTFSVDDDLPAWAWLGRPVQPYSPQIERDLFAAFMENYTAFLKRDVSRLMALGAVRYREFATAFREPVDAYTAASEKDWRAVFEEHEPRAWPKMTSPDDLVFTPCWNGALYRINPLNGVSPLTTIPSKSGMVVEFDVYLGNVNGSWTWVR